MSNEIIRTFFPYISDSTEVRITRIITVGIAVLSATLALWADNIMQLIWSVASFHNWQHNYQLSERDAAIEEH